MKAAAARLRSSFSRSRYKKLKIILTGGPGVGKTSIAQKLRELQFEVKPEIFTELFGKAVNEGKFQELFDDPQQLIHNLVSFQQQLESSTPHEVITFYDRSMIDIVGFAQQLRTNFTESDQTIINHSQYDLVFIIEPLQERYYVQDSIRRQNYRESLEHHSKVTQTYRDYCTRSSQDPQKHLVFVPDLPSQTDPQAAIQARTQFILNRLIELQVE